MAEKRIFASLKSYPRGINSYVDPLLLPADQLSFSVNATVRGNFVTQRPTFFNLTLNDTTGGDFQAGLFQGACFYRTSTNGYIMCAVNGKLFQIAISSDSKTATVTEIVVQTQVIPSGETYSSGGLYSIVLKPNTAYSLVIGANETGGWSWSATGTFTHGNLSITSANANGILYLSGTAGALVTATITDLTQNTTTTPQNWLWQAEQFLIWNDGVTLPLFFDGSTTFRSMGPNPAALTSLAAGFTVPAIGEFAEIGTDIKIPTNSAWPIGPGMVLIGSALYDVQGFEGGTIGGQVTLGLSSILEPSGSFPSGATIAAGTHFLANNTYCGIISAAQLVSNTDSSLSTANNYPPIPVDGTPGDQMTVSVLWQSASGTVPDGANIQLFNSEYKIVSSSVSTFPSAPVAGTGASASAVSFYPTINYPSQIINNTASAYYFNVHPSTSNGATVYVNGSIPCTVSNIADESGSHAEPYIDSMLLTPQNTSATGVVVSSIKTGDGSVVAGTNPTLNGGTAGTPNTFVLTLSHTFLGSDGDTLSILMSGNSTFQSVKVQSHSGNQVTCVMPTGYVANGTTIPIGAYALDETVSYSQIGTIINGSMAVPAQGQTGLVITCSLNSGVTLTVGQVVQIYCSAGSFAAVITTAPSGGGTYGGQPNYFILTLSNPFGGNVGDTLQTGSTVGVNLAQFSVVTPTITGLTSNQVQCQMTTSGGYLIPKGSPYNTDRILINEFASGATTQVGAYVSGAPSSTCTIVTSQDASSPAQFSVIQVQTSTGVILFLVTSVSGASSGSATTVTLKNINDTAGNVVAAGEEIYSLPQLPVGKMGCYGMGRNWVSLPDGVSYVASDMVGSSTGSAEYNYTDAVLMVSQNYFLAGGGTFKISGSGEVITAMQFVAQLDASLGQGPLQIFTDDTVFSNFAPADMTTWSQLTSPIQVEGLIGSGAVSQDAVVQQNNDLIFRLSDGGVQSMLMASQNFNQWGNTPISNEVVRAISGDDPALVPFTSMTVFNNRMLMTCQPTQGARGVYFGALAALNFDPISSLSGKAPSVWDGQWNAPNCLKLITGVFNGVKQCFMLCLSQDLTQIQLVRIQLDNEGTLDNDAQPVAWNCESPMLFKEPENASQPRLYKRLVNGEFSVKGITGDVTYAVSYRSDQNPNWTPWYSSKIVYGGASDPGYRRRIPIGSPSPKVFDPTNNQPMREGYNFQVKFEFTGSCVLTNARFAADEIPEPEFGKPT